MSSHAHIKGISILQSVAQRHGIVELGPKFDADGVGLYGETGMMARMLRCWYDARDEGWAVELDYAPFEAHNRPLESRSFYESGSRRKRTAREAGFYKPQTILYIDLDVWDQQIRPVNPITMALLETYAAVAPDLSYADWINNLAVQRLGLSVS